MIVTVCALPPAVVTVTRLTAYQEWAAANNLTGPNSGPNADFDGDGISNFMELALNTNPNAPSVAFLPTVANVVNAADSKHYLTMSHRRRIVPGTLSYVLRSSPDLGVWTDVPAGNLQQVGAAVPVGDGITEVVTFRVLPSIEDSPAPWYVRLKVSE